jgi:hypothetical protein
MKVHRSGTGVEILDRKTAVTLKRGWMFRYSNPINEYERFTCYERR